MFTLISHENGDICDGDEGVVGFVQFVITSKYSSELFDITEVTLYDIPLFVQLLIVLPRFFTVAFRWHHWMHSTLFRLCPTLVAFLRLVHHQRFILTNLRRNLLHQQLPFRGVRRRSRRQTAGNRKVHLRNDGVDFGRPSSTAFADGLRPLF